jgi:hypothetical protein
MDEVKGTSGGVIMCNVGGSGSGLDRVLMETRYVYHKSGCIVSLKTKHGAAMQYLSAKCKWSPAVGPQVPDGKQLQCWCTRTNRTRGEH